MAKRKDFGFGIEAEYLLVDLTSGTAPRALWHPDVNFSDLNALLENIPLDGLPSLAELELEPPHRKLMPYVVEGYHLPMSGDEATHILPKGLEIRTPVSCTVEGCLSTFDDLLTRLSRATSRSGWGLTALSYHPTAPDFRGPKNKRRDDFWHWAMRAMTTYGPDINISLPDELSGPAELFDLADFSAVLNYYMPALTALTLASPFTNGDLWWREGQPLLSVRTFKRSIVAPLLEYHPEENGRFEFKPFEMPQTLTEWEAYLLVSLTLLLGRSRFAGRAGDAERIYDMGTVAQRGLAANPRFAERVAEVLEVAETVLPSFGFATDSLQVFWQRLQSGQTPAHQMIDQFLSSGRDLSFVLTHRSPILSLVPSELKGYVLS